MILEILPRIISVQVSCRKWETAKETKIIKYGVLLLFRVSVMEWIMQTLCAYYVLYELSLCFF